MQEFPIYRVISESSDDPDRRQIAVLRIKTVGDQAVMCSVNRHIHRNEGWKWIGRHPDYYDGVDTRNCDAEKMFADLEGEITRLGEKLTRIDEEIAQWTEQKKFDEMAKEIADKCRMSKSRIRGVLELFRPLVVQKLNGKRASVEAQIANTEIKREHAKMYLADIQREFPRLVAYVQK